jgi:hypothetical protein
MDSMTVSVVKTVVRSGQSTYANAAFFQALVPDTPDSVEYKVEDVATGDLIRAFSPSVPATSSSAILEDEDVTLLSAADLKEYRRVTFRAVKGATTLEESALYLITNLGFQSIIVSLDCEVSPTLERYIPLPSSRISRVVELDNWNP